MRCAEDEGVPPEISKELMAYFDEGTRVELEHPGGHDVPRDTLGMQQFVDFLLQQARALGADAKP